MAATTRTVETRSIAENPPPKIKPVKWWAAMGVVSLGLIAFSWGRWLLGGHAHPTSVGADPVPTYMVAAARIHEVVFLAAGLFGVYWTIIRPWRREHRLRFDGMLCIALATDWMLQDPWLNYGRVFYTFNSALVNLGCPQCYLPGWQSFGQTMSEPIIFAWSWYFGFALFSVFLFCRVMRWFQNRWPRYGKLGPIFFIFCTTIIFDAVTEAMWLRSGLYVYVNAPRLGTLFYGHFYQLPIVEVATASLWYCVPTAMRYFRNDKGQSWAERGIDEVKATPRQRTALRLLAVIGMLNAGVFLVYNLPTGLVSMQISNWPRDTLSRSYLRDEMCGPGTKFACYDPRVPIPVGPKSGYVTPEGRFIAPEGLPVQTPN